MGSQALLCPQHPPRSTLIAIAATGAQQEMALSVLIWIKPIMRTA